ncbi:MAG: hypothetical protein SNI70_10800 [Rikenellaceae bacterium]
MIRIILDITIKLSIIATLMFALFKFVLLEIPTNAWLWLAIILCQIFIIILIYRQKQSDKLDRWSYQKEQRIEDKLRDIDYYLRRKFKDYKDESED